MPLHLFAVYVRHSDAFFSHVTLSVTAHRMIRDKNEMNDQEYTHIIKNEMCALDPTVIRMETSEQWQSIHY